MSVKNSLTRQITMVFLGVFGLILALYVAVNTVFIEKFYTSRLQRSLIRAYEQIDAHVTVDGADQEWFNHTLSQIIRSNGMSMVIVDGDNEIIARTNDSNALIMKGRIFGYINGLEKDDAKVLKETALYTIQKKSDSAVGIDFLEIWGMLSTGYYCMMRIPLDAIRANAGISSQFLLYMSLLSVLLISVIIWWVSNRITAPIHELTGLSRRMANLDFDVRYTAGGQNEIGQLGENFNRMSETLEETFSQLKSANAKLQQDIEHKTQIEQMRTEFLANVSHELKTPIALISGYAEGLLECVSDDPESRQFYCEVIMDEAAKMNNMVRKLLTLNELEFGQSALDIQRFDLASLIRGKAASSALLLDQQQITLKLDIPETVYVWGDEFKIEEVLTNYISNAMNHCDGEKMIIVSVEKKDGIVRTMVHNTGRPIPEEDLPKVWDKFYKVDKARTREYGGSGVGLSIVRAIMDAHNQKYGAENTQDGVTFWFELEDASASEKDA